MAPATQDREQRVYDVRPDEEVTNGRVWEHRDHGEITITGQPYRHGPKGRKVFVAAVTSDGEEVEIPLADFEDHDVCWLPEGEREEDFEPPEPDPESPEHGWDASKTHEHDAPAEDDGEEEIHESTPANPDTEGAAAEPEKNHPDHGGQMRIVSPDEAVFSTNLGGPPVTEGAFQLTGQISPAPHDAEIGDRFLWLCYGVLTGGGVKKGKKNMTIEIQAAAEYAIPEGRSPAEVVHTALDLRSRPERERPIVDNAISLTMSILAEDQAVVVDNMDALEERLTSKLYERFSISAAGGAAELEDGQLYARDVQAGQMICLTIDEEMFDVVVESNVEIAPDLHRLTFQEKDVEPIELEAHDPVTLTPADEDVVDTEVVDGDEDPANDEPPEVQAAARAANAEQEAKEVEESFRDVHDDSPMVTPEQEGEDGSDARGGASASNEPSESADGDAEIEAW